MIEIDPKQSTILKFEVDVSGSEAIPKPRLVIPISEKGISLIFEGIINDGKVEVDVSELLQLTDSKKFKGKLEVIVEDSIFVPWEEDIVIKKSAVVKAKTINSSVKESKIVVTASNNEDSDDSLMEIKKKSIRDLFNEEL